MSDFQTQRIKRNIKKGTKRNLNMDIQYYKGIPLRLICRDTYQSDKAKRFTINETNFSNFGYFKVSASSLCFYYENETLKEICKYLNRYIDSVKMKLILN